MHDDEFERDLGRRLRAYESRLPDAIIPNASAQSGRPLGWARVALAASAVAATVIVAAVTLGQPVTPIGDRTSAPTSTEVPRSIAPIASSPASDRGAPSASPSSSPGALDSTIRWTPGTPPEGEVYDIARIGDTWVAVGSDGIAAAAWSSTDLVSWMPAEPIAPEPIDGPDGTGYWITTVAPFDGGAVAFGWNRIGCCDNGRPMMWRTTDLRSWAEVDTSGTAYDFPHVPHDAVATADGSIVLITGIDLGSASTTLRLDADLSWKRVDISGTEEFEPLRAIAASSSAVVAVSEAPEAGVRLWTSPDGRAWSQSATLAETKISSLTWDEGSHRFVAGGTDSAGNPSAWLSSDGTSWSHAVIAVAPGMVATVSTADGLIVAAGFLGPENVSQREVVAWESRDGETWRSASLGTHPAPFLLSAAAANSAVIWMRTTVPDGTTAHALWSGTFGE